MSDNGIHASWKNAHTIDDLRQACEVAGISAKGSTDALVARLKKALPSMGYVAVVGLSKTVKRDEDGKTSEVSRVAEAGQDITDEAFLAESGWWLYRAGKIAVKES